jgi:hypothetical protein
MLLSTQNVVIMHVDMGNGLTNRRTVRCTHVRRGVLYMFTPTLDGWPLRALGQHHPSYHGVQPVLALHNATLRSSPPRGNQDGRGYHLSDSVCRRDAHPFTIRVNLYATLAGASLTHAHGTVMGMLPIDMKQWDMSNAEHRHPMLGETRDTDVLMPTSWQGHSPPSREPVGRPPRQRVDVRNPCAIPNPELPDRRMRPTMPCPRHVPPSARPPLHGGIPNVSDGG